ncbi:uncharacterized protein SPSK_00993 [Sporothrix schenckii 1099-18]|uniref:Uncharacterized protein n=1 Tax=Sporothrix schenckii 1099-18 TaxID=1397361 RepID=A0A0F2LWN0_SPOSC|nr:uncharacterized protein SPSK_00993 [Sporothrix schenckii 1099-18]KJR81239.1 hypothetical protein SPSK_00993 [Sporothrix schenckii 1099-18]
MDDSANVSGPTNNDLVPLAMNETEIDEDHMADSSSPPDTPPARIYTPPPHIAARFYRPSAQARRKSSAASSRRNSISSNHSRSSHGFGYPTSSSPTSGAPQSKHVAQHLRRASILADRKARLADRAAHAEQVRLRAAMAKAAVRDISVSEERAQAAAQAREKKLEEIAAACAEEVKRAKAVAETMKEKREQDLLRLRQQIKDRLDEAERRREELRRNNAAGRTRARGQSIPSTRKTVEVMPQVAELKETASPASGESNSSPSRDTPAPALTPDEAAYKILHWWRRSHRRRAIAEFQQLGLAVDSVRNTSFDEVVQLLAQDKVLMTTGKILRLCGIQEGKTSSVKEIVVVRAFLSAFLILGHPTQVLSSKESQDAVTSGQSINYALNSAAARGNTSSSTTSTGTNSNAIANGASPSEPDVTNPQLQDVVRKAKDLLVCFETIVNRLTPANNYTPPSTLASELIDSYDSFYDAFIAWKARDASALVDVMVMQFVELDAIWQTVKDGTDASVSDTYRQSIQQNQVLLLVRIKKLAGAEEGKKKVFAAVHKARKAKEEANRKAAAASANNYMRPREAHDTSIETAMGGLTSDGNSTAATGTATSATGTQLSHNVGPLGRGTASGAVNDATIAGLLPQTKPSAEARTGATLRDLHLEPADEVYSSSPLPENRIVVHELTLNREYVISATQFQKKQEAWMAPIVQRMRKTMSADDGQMKEEHFYYLLTMADCIRSKLERLTIPGKKMHQFIGELLDTEVAQRQFAKGSFSYEKFFSAVGGLLPQLCAPFRDPEVKDLIDNKLQEGDYVDRLVALMAFIDLMLTDHINFMIKMAAPELIASSTQYEQRRFASLVSGNNNVDVTNISGIAATISVGDKLPASAAAWMVARNKVVAEVAKRDPEGINHPRSRPKPDQFYAQMLVDVFTQLSPIPLREMPEMLRLDHERAQKWGAMTRRIVTAGAVLLQCKNLLKRDVRLPWKTEAFRVMAVLEKAENDAAQEQQGPKDQKEQKTLNTLNSTTVIDGVMAALESGRSMPASTKAQLRTIVERTMAASAEAAVARNSPEAGGGDAIPQEPVLRLLLHRLRGYLVARLAAISSAERTRQTSAAGDRLTGLGLAEFVDRVREMMEEMTRVSTVDRETHGAFWESVSSHVESEAAATSVSPRS